MSNKIFHYRVDGTHDECAADNPWSQWLINHETNSDEFTINHLVTIGGQPIISQHRATYLTGTDTCHAHHFAKMLAGTILSGCYQYAPSLTTSPTKPITIELYNGLGPNGTTRHHTTSATPGTVLWIDTIHSPYDCAQLYSEMKENFHFDDGNFNLVCLDMLGVFREDYYCVINRIESHISELKPALIVIDDVDHFLPHCGINVASTFNHIVRDTLNHTESAFLFIGYNHLGKRASTTGDLGKFLFPSSNSVFSVNTQNGISHVRIVKAFQYTNNDTPEFIFSIGEGNLPHEMVKTIPSGTIPSTIVEHSTLQDIISEVIEPDEKLSTEELAIRISKRQTQLNRINKARTIISQALTYGLIKKQNGSNTYILCSNKLDPPINTQLTLPPTLSATPTESSQERVVEVLRAASS